MEQTIDITQIIKLAPGKQGTLTEQSEQDRKIEETFQKEGNRLRNFIRTRVPNEIEAEDILQDVFFQLIETYRFMKPVEKVSSWLFTVARNKITDMFRKKKPELIESKIRYDDDDETSLSLLDLIVAPDASPEGELMQNAVMEELENALSELPEEQRYVFLEHEIEGKSFKEIAQNTGVTVNTLISRKRYAILYLRERLESIYLEFIND